MAYTTELCRQLIKSSEYKAEDLAKEMGLSLTAMSNRISRGTFKAEDFYRLMDLLGYEVILRDKKTHEEVRSVNGAKRFRVKKNINGVTYDTANAKAICYTDDSKGVFQELYKTKDGEYFVVNFVRWAGGKSSISPISSEDAKKFIQGEIVPIVEKYIVE